MVELLKPVTAGNAEKIKPAAAKMNFQTSCNGHSMYFHNRLEMDPIRNVKLQENGKHYEAHFQLTNNLNQM